ncbi:hypothetical protein E4U15_000063 [Claviceps sp. LM218 group G6]|nr:hypothetical protein E4U15_000063 [Claviceps sp. LM218 group G6]
MSHGSEAVKRNNSLSRENFAPHIMTQVDRLHAKGITGKGVKVAIIDGDVDFTYPALGNGGLSRVLISSVTTSTATYYYDPVPDANLMDNCDGHGAHVAGTIATQKTPLGSPAQPLMPLSEPTGVWLYILDQAPTTSSLTAFEDGANIITASVHRDGTVLE